MDNTRIEWLPGFTAGELILLIDGVEAGRVRRSSKQEMQGWYWATKDAILTGGGRIPGDCVADSPLENAERAKEDLLACIAVILDEQVQGDGH